jgi:hypothetical protein
MSAVVMHRCFLHDAREAAGRCKDCARFFCRECVTDYDGRILCASCIRARVSAVNLGSEGRRRFPALFRNGLAALSALLIAWATFYLAGVILANFSGGHAH